jgi:SAM-dependent methyltransferase
MKHIFVRSLHAIGLLGLSFRFYENIRAFIAELSRFWRPKSQISPDGLPLPSPKLILLVSGHSNSKEFWAEGCRAFQSICHILSRNGLNIQSFQNVLDFGCGCGRVIRHFYPWYKGNLYGTDYNIALIQWCQRNLPFAKFAVNNLKPPLPFPENKVDLVYALSVFTHLSEPLQGLWMKEMFRILAPGGYLIFTTHGAGYLDVMTADERVKFQEGYLVVRYEEYSGMNLCASFHPFKYVKEVLCQEFILIDFIPEGAWGNGRQDIYLLKKPI